MRSALVLSFVLLFVASSAEARSPDPEGSYLVLDRLLAGVADDEVIIDIAVEARSWSWAQNQRVTPIVSVEVAFDGGSGKTKEVVLDKREARLRVAVDHNVAVRNISISIYSTGRTNVAPLRWFELRGQRLERMRIALDVPAPARDDHAAAPVREPAPAPAREPVPKNWAADPETISACASAVREQKPCMDAVRDMQKSPAPMIEACESAFNSRAARQTCIEQGAKSKTDPTTFIGTCGFKLFGSQDKALECVTIASRAPVDPSRTIEACSESGNKSQTLACLRTAYP